MPLTSTLHYFARSEFHHPELIEDEAALFLDAVRGVYGSPIVLTSDARTAAENAAASGSSPTSLHLQGRAFDFHFPATEELAWKLVAAVLHVASYNYPDRGIELELVNSAVDHHVHIGLFADGRPSRLIVRAD